MEVERYDNYYTLFFFNEMKSSSKTHYPSQAPLLCIGKLPIGPRNCQVLDIGRQCLFDANENREKAK